jgi:hypothetical protein
MLDRLWQEKYAALEAERDAAQAQRDDNWRKLCYANTELESAQVVIDAARLQWEFGGIFYGYQKLRAALADHDERYPR